MAPRTGTFPATVGTIIIAAVSLLAAAVSAQRIDDDLYLNAGRQRLERPSDLTVSPTGEQIAIADPSLNRIGVVDYLGRALWAVGDQVNLDQPLAVCFLSENALLFSARANNLLVSITRDNPTVIDTVADLSPFLQSDERADQIVALKSGSYLVLDKTGGRVLRFDSNWKLTDIPIANGSGKGKVLVPTALVVLADGRIVVTDRKNYPAQMFGPDGTVQFNFGWSQPADERGWEAAAAGVDSRRNIWIADETNDQFRVFDPSGTQIGSLSFPDPLFRPIAMTGTLDNRMLVLDDRGRAVFYTLQ